MARGAASASARPSEVVQHLDLGAVCGREVSICRNASVAMFFFVLFFLLLSFFLILYCECIVTWSRRLKDDIFMVSLTFLFLSASSFITEGGLVILITNHRDAG